MTALGIMAQATAAGLTMRPYGDKIRFRPVENMTPELLAEMREHRLALLDLLRAGRIAEIKAFFAQSFGRLGALYGDDLIGNLWPAIVAQHPDLARAIDVAEQAADAAALSYQQGTTADSSAFLACLATWERAWAEAIGAITSRACSDCGRVDATVMVTTDTGRFCRRCLRPEPLNTKPRTKGMDA